MALETRFRRLRLNDDVTRLLSPKRAATRLPGLDLVMRHNKILVYRCPTFYFPIAGWSTPRRAE